MGALGEAMGAFAEPLLEASDGSEAGLNKAFALAQVCWNLALLPDEEAEASIADMQSALNMDDDEFQDFREKVIRPMIQRHHAMFPHMPKLQMPEPSKASPPPRKKAVRSGSTEKFPGTGRNAPCPCGSGKKYKRCCGG